MDQILTLLKSTAVFMLAAQLILQFGPGKQYEKYGKMIVAVIVLAQLAVPVLSIGIKDLNALYTDKLTQFELENDAFTEKMEAMEEKEADVVQNGLLDSVREQLSEEAEAAGVSIQSVRLHDGILTITVGQETAAGVSDVRIEKITVGERTEEKTAGDQRRGDLEELFAARLGMKAEQMEVTQVG